MEEKEHYTTEERDAVSFFERTIKYTGERYQVTLPFKKEHRLLQNNYSITKGKLESLERRIRTPEEKASYEKVIMDYEKLGFARKATSDEIVEFSNGPQYFISHHPVIKQDILTTKTRVVFNASLPDVNDI